MFYMLYLFYGGMYILVYVINRNSISCGLEVKDVREGIM